MARVAVLGAGISGLVAAYQLENAGHKVSVFEAAPYPGGNIKSVRFADEFLAEHGPHTFLPSNPKILTLLEELGLSSEIVEATRDARKRFAVVGGKVTALPSSPKQFLTSEVWSTKEKLRLLAEPFIKSGPVDIDESLHNWSRRRFGDGFRERGIDLFVQGVWAGDSRKLSARHALRKVWELEKHSGSVFRGAIHRKIRVPGARRAGGIFALKNGNQSMPLAIADRLKDLRTNARVTALASDGSGWGVTWQRNNRSYTTGFDAVLSTLPVWALADMDVKQDRKKERLKTRIAHPAVAVTTLAFRREDIAHPLDGFGMLIPPSEERSILGALFPSTLFSGRAPQSAVSIAVFSGGRRTPGFATATPEIRRQTILTELDELLGVRTEPLAVEERVWPRAIPQYEVGYGLERQTIRIFEKLRPGLFIGGAAVDGVAVPDLVAAAFEQASRVNRFCDQRSNTRIAS